MRAKDPTHPRFGHGRTCRRSSQHDETFRRGTAFRPLRSQVVAKLGEEHRVDGNGAFLVALAEDPHPAHATIHVRQSQGADLGRSQTTDQHRERHCPVPGGAQVGEKHGHLVRPEALGQAAGLTDESTTGRRAARPDMAQHSTCLGPQPGRSSRGRHRVIGPDTDDHGVLEHSSNRGNPAVHRRRRSPPSVSQTNDPRPPDTGRLGLPAEVVEQVSRHDITERHAPLDQEPPEIRQVERVGTDRCRRERSTLKMAQERVHRVHTTPPAVESVRASPAHHHNLLGPGHHRSSPPKSSTPSWPPTRNANRARSIRSSPMS